MDIKEILSKCDYTLLDKSATQKDIASLVKRGEWCGVGAFCVPPCFVEYTKKLTKRPVVTVIGFPNGYMSTKTKVFEAKDALESGADELDMVINIGLLRGGDLRYVQNEIESVKKECGDKVLKVIIEACLLSDAEKVAMCKVAKDGGADFIKTSTGFTSGATEHDVKLLVKNANGLKVKAAGGIRTVEAAEKFITLGAERIGTSGIIKDAIIKGLLQS